MKNAEGLKLSGHFVCKVYENDILIKTFSEKNLIVDQGKNRLIDSLISGVPLSISKIGFGEGNTTPAPGDVTLSGTTYNKNVSAAINLTSNSVQFDWFLGTSEGNGIAIKEFGLLFSDASLFARKTGITVAKTSSITITGEWTITIS